MAHWGEKKWFRELYLTQGTSKPSAYFAHRKNGYQKYRHHKLIRFFERSKPQPWTDGGAFLDIGCATGDFSHALLEQTGFDNGTGIDFLEEAIATASKQYPKLSFHVAALPDIPLADKSCDLVVASEVLYYMDELERQATIYSVARVLREDGLFLFTTALGGSYFTPQEARALLEPDFEILAEAFDHVRFYHRFIAPFAQLHRLYEIMRVPELHGRGRLYRLVTRHPRIFGNPVFSAIMGLLTKLSSALFAWRWIPALIARLSELSVEKKARSNILILARVRMRVDCVTVAAKADQV